MKTYDTVAAAPAVRPETVESVLKSAAGKNSRPSEAEASGRPIPELRFRPVTDDTLPLINSLLQLATSRTCDYTVGGIFMWVERFGYQYCVYRDTLFIKGVSETDPTQTAFSMPVGPLPLEECVRLVREYCDYHGIEAVFAAVPEDRLDWLLSVVDGQIEELDDWADYVYDARELADLTGKKYNKKRNHVNRFLAENPHYVFEPLTPSLLPEILLFHTGMNHADGSGADADADNATSGYEAAQCTRVLNRYGSYPFEGAVLRDETGAVCAYTCGEIIGDTLYVHIEKMNHLTPGSGETINKLYAGYMTSRHPAIRYINREEDCGDPGLRHAKESYHPLMRLRKFNLHC